MGKDLNGLPWWLSGKESTPPTNARDLGSILESRKWQPTPVLLPGKFHESEEPVGYSPWTR